MLNLRLVVWMFSVGVMVLGAGVVSSQTYPNKPIHIVTSPPGGGTDLVARTIAQGISGSLGQPVIVENRGAGGAVSGEIVTRGTPDGHTLLVTGNSFWIAPFFRNQSAKP